MPSTQTAILRPAIPALLPHGEGYQFLLYGDSCSGVPGALHEKTFASVNEVARRLRPQPEFILFPGDEIIGLTADADTLRTQWRHWFDTEMAWLDRTAIPIWHTTGNHTTYDAMSEAVFREVLDLPDNGPPGQAGLSYFVRRDNLLMVFVNTLWSGLGGEGHVEMEWLEATLTEHRNARYKLVLGHHPVFPVNGFSGAYQREVGHEYADLAGPGPRRRDVAYTAYWMAPLAFSASEMKAYSEADLANGSSRLKKFCSQYGIPADRELLDMVMEVLVDMGNEERVRTALGAQTADRLRLGGHFEHWQREVAAFALHQAKIERAL